MQNPFESLMQGDKDADFESLLSSFIVDENEQPTEVPTEMPTEQLTGQSTGQPIEQPEHPPEHPPEQLPEHPSEHPTEHPTEHPSERPDSSAYEESVKMEAESENRDENGSASHGLVLDGVNTDVKPDTGGDTGSATNEDCESPTAAFIAEYKPFREPEYGRVPLEWSLENTFFYPDAFGNIVCLIDVNRNVSDALNKWDDENIGNKYTRVLHVPGGDKWRIVDITLDSRSTALLVHLVDPEEVLSDRVLMYRARNRTINDFDLVLDFLMDTGEREQIKILKFGSHYMNWVYTLSIERNDVESSHIVNFGRLDEAPERLNSRQFDTWKNVAPFDPVLPGEEYDREHTCKMYEDTGTIQVNLPPCSASDLFGLAILKSGRVLIVHPNYCRILDCSPTPIIDVTMTMDWNDDICDDLHAVLLLLHPDERASTAHVRLGLFGAQGLDIKSEHAYNNSGMGDLPRESEVVDASLKMVSKDSYELIIVVNTKQGDTQVILRSYSAHDPLDNHEIDFVEIPGVTAQFVVTRMHLYEHYIAICAISKEDPELHFIYIFNMQRMSWMRVLDLRCPRVESMVLSPTIGSIAVSWTDDPNVAVSASAPILMNVPQHGGGHDGTPQKRVVFFTLDLEHYRLPIALRLALAGLTSMPSVRDLVVQLDFHSRKKSDDPQAIRNAFARAVYQAMAIADRSQYVPLEETTCYMEILSCTSLFWRHAGMHSNSFISWVTLHFSSIRRAFLKMTTGSNRDMRCDPSCMFPLLAHAQRVVEMLTVLMNEAFNEKTYVCGIYFVHPIMRSLITQIIDTIFSMHAYLSSLAESRFVNTALAILNDILNNYSVDLRELRRLYAETAPMVSDFVSEKCPDATRCMRSLVLYFYVHPLLKPLYDDVTSIFEKAYRNGTMYRKELDSPDRNLYLTINQKMLRIIGRDFGRKEKRDVARRTFLQAEDASLERIVCIRCGEETLNIMSVPKLGSSDITAYDTHAAPFITSCVCGGRWLGSVNR